MERAIFGAIFAAAVYGGLSLLPSPMLQAAWNHMNQKPPSLDMRP